MYDNPVDELRRIASVTNSSLSVLLLTSTADFQSKPAHVRSHIRPRSKSHNVIQS